MKIRFERRAIALAMLSFVAAPAVNALEVIQLPSPVNSSLNSNAVICSAPETLFLLYESTRNANAKDESLDSAAFFDTAFAPLAESKSCVQQKGEISVTVTAVTFMENAWHASKAQMAYGEFEHPLFKTIFYAPLLTLPGLGDYMSDLVSDQETSDVPEPASQD